MNESETGAQSVTADSLSDYMGFGCVIRVHSDRTIDVNVSTEQGINADEILYTQPDGNGGSTEPDLFTSGYGEGWSLLTNWSGQYGYHGAVMRPSEYIGGNLAQHILDTPGLWVAVLVDYMPNTTDDESAESEPEGWALLHYSGDL